MEGSDAPPPPPPDPPANDNVESTQSTAVDAAESGPPAEAEPSAGGESSDNGDAATSEAANDTVESSEAANDSSQSAAVDAAEGEPPVESEPSAGGESSANGDAETTDEAQAETPGETEAETPDETEAETPDETEAETPDEAEAETTGETSDGADTNPASAAGDGASAEAAAQAAAESEAPAESQASGDAETTGWAAAETTGETSGGADANPATPAGDGASADAAAPAVLAVLAVEAEPPQYDASKLGAASRVDSASAPLDADGSRTTDVGKTDASSTNSASSPTGASATGYAGSQLAANDAASPGAGQGDSPADASSSSPPPSGEKVPPGPPSGDAADGGMLRLTQSDPAKLATAAQHGEIYKHPDDWRNTTLSPGDVVVQLGDGKNPSDYFMPIEALETYLASGATLDESGNLTPMGVDASALAQAAQVKRGTYDPQTGTWPDQYRGKVHVYQLNHEMLAARSGAFENLEFGSGGMPQYFIPNAGLSIASGDGRFTEVGTVNMSNRDDKLGQLRDNLRDMTRGDVRTEFGDNKKDVLSRENDPPTDSGGQAAHELGGAIATAAQLQHEIAAIIEATPTSEHSPTTTATYPAGATWGAVGPAPSVTSLDPAGGDARTDQAPTPNQLHAKVDQLVVAWQDVAAWSSAVSKGDEIFHELRADQAEAIQGEAQEIAKKLEEWNSEQQEQQTFAHVEHAPPGHSHGEAVHAAGGAVDPGVAAAVMLAATIEVAAQVIDAFNSLWAGTAEDK